MSEQTKLADGSALIQLRSALRMCEKDGSDLVSVPLSAAEIRALIDELTRLRAERPRAGWDEAIEAAVDAAHTPGPWHVYGGYYVDVAHKERGHIATAEEAADARLIAAAPDLLAVCEQVALAIHDSPLRRQVEDAITRARGVIPMRPNWNYTASRSEGTPPLTPRQAKKSKR